ncbi:MAG: N-acetylmuramoyl-L-alanine amidase [Gemmatimonadetes bacterium]|nr:N-acetylmuramoyl-L-alanine amidase [Gemmatimonadota bacterium]
MIWGGGAMLLVAAAAPAGPSTEPEAPAAVVIATSRGTRAVPVSTERGHPALPADELSILLPMSTRWGVDGWITVDFGGQAFRFLLNAPIFEFRNRIIHVVGGAYMHRDSLFVPLQWLAEYVPRTFREAYRYDPLAARFEEVGMTPVASRVSQPPSSGSFGAAVEDAPAAARSLGLKRKHRVVVDAGHGGGDSGTLGGNLVEKNLALAISSLLQEELERRGIEAVLTRTTDVLIPWSRRAPRCRDDCDLFVSIHVNALERAPGYRNIGGLETYFFDYRRQNAPDRLEQRENSSLRYQPQEDRISDDPVTTILSDLEENEYMRESAQLADLVREYAGRAHPNGSRKVVQRNFQVLRWATRPAILVETGYSTNRRDAEFLSSREGRRRLARGIADGIVQYLLRYETMTNQ